VNRGDTVNDERSHSDRDDEGEELGGFTGGIPYDEDEDEDGGWAINKDHSDSLWDSAEETDDDDDAETTELVDAGESEEEETDLFGGTLNTPRKRGRRPAEKPAPVSDLAVPASALVGTAAVVAAGAGAKGKEAKPATKPAGKPAGKPAMKSAPKAKVASSKRGSGKTKASKAPKAPKKSAARKSAPVAKKAKKATKPVKSKKAAKGRPAPKAKKSAKKAKAKK
jgi:hypothetical protein